MRIYTRFNREKSVGEVNKGKYKVEIGTYQSSEKLIKSFINAGKIISSVRESSYDFPDGVDDGRSPDPTRRPDFDLADVTRLKNEMEQKYLNGSVEKLSEEAAVEKKPAAPENVVSGEKNSDSV